MSCRKACGDHSVCPVGDDQRRALVAPVCLVAGRSIENAEGVWKLREGGFAPISPPWIYRTAHTTVSSVLSSFTSRCVSPRKYSLAYGCYYRSTATALYAMYQNARYYMNLQKSWRWFCANASVVGGWLDRATPARRSRTVTHRRVTFFIPPSPRWLSLREPHSVQRITSRLYATALLP